jgi:hypothetical protein
MLFAKLDRAPNYRLMYANIEIRALNQFSPSELGNKKKKKRVLKGGTEKNKKFLLTAVYLTFSLDDE